MTVSLLQLLGGDRVRMERGELCAGGWALNVGRDDDGTVAVFAQHAGRVPVVLTDMMMPVMDGPATVRALLRLDPQVKIIAASGLTPGRKTVEVALAGVQAFLPKPYAVDALLRTIDEILHPRPTLDVSGI